MYYPELRGYLTNAVSAEELKEFDDGIALLEAFHVDEFMDTFDTVLGELTDKADTAVIDGFKANLFLMTRSLVAMHGVTLDEDVTQGVVLRLLDALKRLPEWADQDALERVLQLDVSPEERFSELGALVLGCPVEELLPFITQVDPGLLERLGENMVDTAELGRFDDEIRAVLIDYRKLHHAASDHAFWSDFALSHLPAIGLPFELHLKHFLNDRQEQVNAATTAQQFTQLALELLGVACISDSRLSGALVAIRAHAADIFTDSRSLTLDVILTKLYTEVNRATA